ncbi:MAG: c-type cytochrome [Gemmatimonas sp.]
MRVLAAVLMLVLTVAACEREERDSREQQAPASSTRTLSQSDIYPGASSTPPPSSSRYDDRAFDVSEGQRLFSSFNCVGCHAHGGGGMGPPLMDEHWIYGSEPNNIFATIVEGRPNGMPSFGGLIPDQQVWQLVAYVRSLSGLVPKTSSSTRTDHMSEKVPQQPQDFQQPDSSVTPPSATK